mgnify:CR=1 FL=1
MLFRSAEPFDLPDVAELATSAGGGLFEYCLGGASFIETSEGVGLLSSALEDGFCMNNATVCCDDNNSVAGTLISYPSSEFSSAEAFASFIQPALLEPVSGIFALPEDPSYYVHSLAVKENFTRRGIASNFLKIAEDAARGLGLEKVRLHVWSDNQPAVAMYNGHGYITEQVIPVDTGGALDHQGGMLLVAKDIN